MAKTDQRSEQHKPSLPKSRSGISGLDEITLGGLPRGRPTLVCGGAGCGKTLLAMEFLLRGATQFGENGVFMSFEETAEELAQNVRSLGFDLSDLISQKKISVDHVHFDRAEIEETGDYDLEALFLRLSFAIDSVGAKRVVLDTIEALFTGFSNPSLLRSELRRLFRWLKLKGVTAVITGERGEGTLTRHGLEEYVADCVLILDHRVRQEISTRRLRIVKYRGTTHGTNEYPFLIDQDGISVLPVTSVRLNHEVSRERMSTGISGLDAMLGGAGFFRGSSILISGPAGTGKTTVASCVADAACRRGEKALFLSFEEAPQQLVRNMASVGLDLASAIESGRLRVQASRESSQGLEMHLLQLHGFVETFHPTVVVIDPITTFSNPAVQAEVDLFVLRVVDFLKEKGITAVICHSTARHLYSEGSGIFSLIDTWIDLRDIEGIDERTRGMAVLKSRGMEHSNRVARFRITSNGIRFDGNEADRASKKPRRARVSRKRRSR